MSCVLGASSCYPVSTTPAAADQDQNLKTAHLRRSSSIGTRHHSLGVRVRLSQSTPPFLFTKCERKNNTETLLFHSRRRIVEMPWRCCFGAIPSPPLRYFTSKASYQDGSITSSNLQRRSPEDSRFFDLRLKNLPRILVKPNR